MKCLSWVAKMCLGEQNISLNRPGVSRITIPTNKTSTQTDNLKLDKPKIRINHNCSNEIK